MNQQYQNEEIALRHTLVEDNVVVPDVEQELDLLHQRIDAKPQHYRRNLVLAFITGAAALLLAFLMYKPVMRMMQSHETMQMVVAQGGVSIKDGEGNVYLIALGTDRERLLCDYGVMVYSDDKIALPASLTGLSDAREGKLTISTSRQAECHVLLSDGSEVWLNGNTNLEMSTLFEKEKRDVYLSGEAYFKVTKDKNRQFSVYTEKMVTNVTGTEFLIRSYPGEECSVTLVKGSVKTRNIATNETKELVPGEKMTIAIDGSHEVCGVKTAVLSDRTDGFFCYDNETLEFILRDIARWFGCDMRIENTASAAVHLYFEADKHDSLEEIVNLLNSLSSAKVEVADSVLIIK